MKVAFCRAIIRVNFILLVALGICIQTPSLADELRSNVKVSDTVFLKCVYFFGDEEMCLMAQDLVGFSSVHSHNLPGSADDVLHIHDSLEDICDTGIGTSGGH